MPRWVDYIPEIHKKILAQKFGPNDSQIISAIAHPVEAINRGGEWFRHNVSQASGGDPYDNPNPLIGPTQTEQAEAGTNIAGLAQVGNMPGAPSSAGGTLGTFIGPKAATWDKERAALAQQLLDAGADPKQVWKHLTIGKMPGGHLFSEIPDNEMSYGQGFFDYAQDGKRLSRASDFIDHPELNKAYPELMNKTGVVITPMDSLGSYNSDGKIVSLNQGGFGKKDMQSPFLHETQHAIQDQEGWPTGGSPNNTPLYDADKVFEIRQHRKALGIDPEQVRGMIDAGQPVTLSLRERLNKYDDLLRQEKEIIDNPLAPIEAYRRLQGEAQARLTQDRIPLTMEQRREQYPLEGNMIADIPFNKLITRYGGSGDQRSIINQMAKGGKK
jgi:hypothetical protein